MSDTVVYYKGKSSQQRAPYEARDVFQNWKEKDAVRLVRCSTQISMRIYYPDFVFDLGKDSFFAFDGEKQESAYEKALAALDHMHELKSV